MVYESKTENYCLIVTVGSTAVLTFDLCMHQCTHSAETVQTWVYHATSSANNAEISPSFVNSLYGDPSHPYMAAPLREQKKIMIFMIQQIVWRKEPKSFDVVMNYELYNYCSYDKPQYWPRNAQLFHLYSYFTFYFQSKPQGEFFFFLNCIPFLSSSVHSVFLVSCILK